MSKYKTELELNPSPNNPLVALTTKIETLVENEPINLARAHATRTGGYTQKVYCAYGGPA
jgi:hypothetical protein